MPTKFQVKRNSVSGIVPTTGDISPGELAINLADRKLFTANATAVFELGSNLTNLSVTGNTTIAGLIANGSLGSAGQVLHTNGTTVYWDTDDTGGGSGSVNTAAQYVWTNTHIFNANLTANATLILDSSVNLDTESTTLATVSQSQIASFAVASYRSCKFVVQIYDSVSGEVQISELLLAHNGTTASATEYGVVHTGTSPLVSFDVDINAGNVRLLATRTTTNSTQYKVFETLMVA